MNALRNDINPRFIHFTTVTSPATDLTTLIDEAIADYDPADGPVVRDAEIELLQPLRPAAVRVPACHAPHGGDADRVRLVVRQRLDRFRPLH